jgi:adenosylcobinamide-phosphate synthase
MLIVAIVFALLLEQVRPLSIQTPVYEGVRAWSRWVCRMLDAGQHHHAKVAWAVAVLVPALLSWAIYAVLSALSSVLAFVWLVVVLYWTLGFRQFSFHFTNVRVALESGDERGAREALREWTQTDVQDLGKDGILRQTIAYGVLSAHRHVFGVVVSFVVLAWMGLGPAGAVLYRVAQHVMRRWQEGDFQGPSPALQAVAQAAWRAIDWVPSRITALVFAVVGHFEEAVANWRQEAGQPHCSHDTVLLAAAAGALNLNWHAAGDSGFKLAHLSSVVGLVWRSVVVWFVLLLLVTLARF